VNRSKLSLRRPLAVLGAAVLGAAAALALASPASAHYSAVAGSYHCLEETGQWDITWTVTSQMHFSATKFKLTRVNLTPAGTTVTNIAESQGDDYPYDTDEVLYGHQLVPGDTDQATLAVKAAWNDGYAEDKAQRAKVKLKGTCEKKTTPPTTAPPAPDVTAPEAAFAPACDGSVKVTLINGEDATVPVDLTVTAKGFEKTYSIEPNGKKDDIVVPVGAGAITVTEKGKTEPVTKPYTWERPEDCGEPSLAYAATCDEFAFEVTNPEDGAPITVTFTPSTGEPQTIDVAPGAVETVTFPGTEGLTVTPSADGMTGEPIAWEPEDCEAAPPTGGGGGELPETGIAAGAIAGGAAVLLAIGAVLYFLARRRRVTFTA
jgi:LPXTG-motif cell wall-anchored protein